MLSACLALYFGQSSYNPRKVGWFGNLGRWQLSYNPGKVGWFGNLGRGQSSDNPGKVGWFGFIEGLYDDVPNVEMCELVKEMNQDGRVVFRIGWATREG